MLWRSLTRRGATQMLHLCYTRAPATRSPVHLAASSACYSDAAHRGSHRGSHLPVLSRSSAIDLQADRRWRYGSSRPSATATSTASADIKLPDYCPGCGIKLQFETPNQPGYARLPKSLEEDIDLFKDIDEEWQQAMGDQERAGIPSTGSQPSTSASTSPSTSASTSASISASTSAPAQPGFPEPPAAAADDSLAALDQAVESWLDDEEEDKRQAHQIQVEEPPDTGTPRIICQRCHSLTHYGKVQNPEAEGLLPEFDLARRVGRKIALQKHRRAIVLCVVDLVDFDGSLPRAAVAAMLPWGRNPGTETPGVPLWDLIVAANKADLLPPCPLTAVENWARMRTAQAGLPKPRAVHAVSSHKDTGVRDLLAALHRAAGGRGDIWVVGAQNAGKSSLINAMRRAVQRDASKRTTITTAALPGTTLSVLRVDGLMGQGCRMFDTPGVPHSHQLTSFLTLPELALVQPKRRLLPRTFRLGAGFSIMVGGSGRVDILQAPSATVYLSVYASMSLPCYAARTEKLDAKLESMLGGELVPPMKLKNRDPPWQALQPCTLDMQGSSWRRHSRDIAFAGLGWVSIGLEGEASFRAWAPPGVAITTRDALLPKFADVFQRPGLGMRDKAKLPKAAKRAVAAAA